MSAIVFLGPSLRVAEARERLEADYPPPARRGDVYEAARAAPTVIGIVDGYFHSVPSVWHKEILWALSRGIHVLGASSIGALRAAELHRYGMVGIGQVFEAFARGELDGDDEVAVLHGPVELDARPLTVPLVNLRATFRRAAETGLLCATAERGLVALAQDLHYSERTYERVLTRAGESADGPLRRAAERLREDLPRHLVDAKADDARALLDAVSELLADTARPRPATAGFVATERWQSLLDAHPGRATRTG